MVKRTALAAAAGLALLALAAPAAPPRTYQQRCYLTSCVTWVTTTIDGQKVWRPLYLSDVAGQPLPAEYEYAPAWGN